MTIDFESNEYHPMVANVKKLIVRLEKLDTETLKAYKSHYGNKLGKTLRMAIDGMLYRREKALKNENTEDPHVDGWYDR